jgi:photosystem II stability/assembly factor-like uncharacterized protein
MKSQRSYSIIIITIILFTITIINHAQGWQWQNPLPQGNPYGDIQFVDSLNGWIRAGGNLLRTTNGGFEWELEYIKHYFGPNSIHFIDNLNGWGVGSGEPPFIVHTNDGGITWEPLPIPEERNDGYHYNFRDVYFIDALTGYFCDDKGGIFKTLNGGYNWIRVYQHLPRRNIQSVFFNDSLNGWAVGNYLPLFKTTDGGDTWIKDSSIVTVNGENHQEISFVDSLNGWIMNTYDFYKTTNGGTTWEEIIIDSVNDGQQLGGLYHIELQVYDNQYLWLSTSWGVYSSSDSGNTWSMIFDEIIFDGIYFLDLVNGYATKSRKYYKTTDAGLSWHDQTFFITEKDLNGVDFIDEQTGWAVGYDGTILHTTNGGEVWQPQTSGSNNHLYDVKFWNGNLGYIVADNGGFLYTTNGGVNWTEKIVREDYRFEEMSFVNPTTGWMVGWNWDYEGIVLQTTNGGTSWEDKTPMNAGSLYSVSFVDSLNGWVTSGGGTIYEIGRAWSTSDGGNTWSLVIDGPYWSFDKVRFADTLNGWIAVENDLLKTTDGGENWETIDNITVSYLIDFMFIDQYKGWATSQFGEIVYSEDGGINWENQKSTISSNSLQEINFIDDNYGWAVGDFGTVIHTETGGITSINEGSKSNQSDLNFELYQNYPNPFNNSTVISFNLFKHSSHVKIFVYNVLGELVNKLLDKELPSGNHRINWDGSNDFGKVLSSGVYFYQVIVDEQINSRKIIMIK